MISVNSTAVSSRLNVLVFFCEGGRFDTGPLHLQHVNIFSNNACSSLEHHREDRMTLLFIVDGGSLGDEADPPGTEPY